MSILQHYLDENRYLFYNDPISHDHGVLGIHATLPPLISFIQKTPCTYDVGTFQLITQAQVEMGIRSIFTYTTIPKIDTKLIYTPEFNAKTLYTWCKLFSYIPEYNEQHTCIHGKYCNYLWYFLPHFCLQYPLCTNQYKATHILPDSIWLLLSGLINNILYNNAIYCAETKVTDYFLAICKYFEDDLWEFTNICIHEAIYYLQKIGVLCLMIRVFDIPNLDVSFKNDIYYRLNRILPSM